MTAEEREQIINELGMALAEHATDANEVAELAQGVRQAWDAFDAAKGVPTASDLGWGALLRHGGATPEQVERFAAIAVRLRRG